jgi:hypothetical protein
MTSGRGRARLTAACCSTVLALPCCAPEPMRAAVPVGPAPADPAREPVVPDPAPVRVSSPGASEEPLYRQESGKSDAAGSAADGGSRRPGLGPEPIRHVVVAHAGALQACYEIEAQKDSSLKGGVTLRWRVDEGGAVTSAFVVGSTLQNARVEGCVLREVRSWRFPTSDGISEVTFPFVFGIRR